MKVIVKARINHGHLLLDAKGQKTYDGSGSGIPLTESYVIEADPTKVIDTDKDEPFKSHFSPADLSALAANGSLAVITEPVPFVPPVPPPVYCTEADVKKIVAEALAAFTAAPKK